MLDSRSSWSAGNHDDVWELIPWYVNGSLPPEDMTVIERHIMSCAECTVEVSRQRGIAAQISVGDPHAVSTARSWKKLSSQIKSERDGRMRRSPPRNRFGGTRGGFMLGGACAAACLLAIFAFIPTDGGFRTLTSSTSGSSNTIKFQTVSGLARAQLEAILAEHGLEFVDGPSESGVYTAIPTRDGADPQASAKALMTAPQIMFAAPAE
ncbi:zf-HC2 domain-containing protein [Rhizobium sp. GN54]|uniref:zf-HC2 domain-containing protein n=1 Tax=Rhizobium sp. GN54 TaxID=2898150 RepID=UPI001E5C5BAB|nr:zf-HC2 domain-containing protein [Rhizobium sp. GN54]MCD2184697.1 zf-HC2 domain-containing protein [Rhizobium sp. GN54]